MEKKTETAVMSSFWFILAALLILFCRVGCSSSSLTEKCSDDFTKVATCLEFATGKAAAPSKECCEAVKDIRGSDPVCLCFIIQVTHNGSAQIRSMGIQESKLLQLPTACNLVNSNISDCPKLLHILPNSTDYAIFTNVSSFTTTAPFPNNNPSANNPENLTSSADSGLLFGPINLAAMFSAAAIVAAIFSGISI